MPQDAAVEHRYRFEERPAPVCPRCLPLGISLSLELRSRNFDAKGRDIVGCPRCFVAYVLNYQSSTVAPFT